ncbi:peroxidase 27-like [Rutidosis leptorrhynchoides]|uniref:peroxidase 27-like n=1 Tax=Rutidosis leptorrhynchoides TaxID=125765 RepID=UPI003A99CE6A
MAMQRNNVVFQILLFTLVFVIVNCTGLQLGFYQTTCPRVEKIVYDTTEEYIHRAPPLAASLLRMHFHDCFVRGCDGSVLLNSTTTSKAEKDGPPNLSLRGFEVVEAAKAALEVECPGVVSCADVLALVARDAIFQIRGPFWPVPLGRRDGRVSLFAESFTLPPPFANITLLKTIFDSKGLSVKDLVVLSGAHTVGLSHCSTIATRLYNFTGNGDTDPSLDPAYVPQLKSICSQTDRTTLLTMDSTVGEFDANYYKGVTQHRGLFQSDAALLNDNQTSAYVNFQSRTNGFTFFRDFGVSMVKMGQIGVLTGTDGEIRKTCALIN